MPLEFSIEDFLFTMIELTSVKFMTQRGYIDGQRETSLTYLKGSMIFLSQPALSSRASQSWKIVQNFLDCILLETASDVIMVRLARFISSIFGREGRDTKGYVRFFALWGLSRPTGMCTH